MLKKVAILSIRAYQLVLSPDQGIFKTGQAVCRFYPSCSNYSLQAIEEFGIFKGLVLTIKRVSRCHPFNPGGLDPIPGKKIIMTNK